MRSLNRPDVKKPDSVIPLRFAGVEIWLAPSGALFIPAESLLVFSDLHLEKGSFFAAKRAPVPVHDTLDTLQKVREQIALFNPKRVVCLGDSFHDVKSFERLHPQDARLLEDIIISVGDWLWVSGNHDPVMPSHIKGRNAPFDMVSTVKLVHEPENEAVPQIVGHFHPKAQFRLQNQFISGRCFVAGEQLLIMPAFGSFTGGLNIEDAAIASLFAEGQKIPYLSYNNKLWKLGKIS